jgi:hypothetical protein
LIDLSTRAGLDWLPWIGMSGGAVVSALGFGLLSRDARFAARLRRGSPAQAAQLVRSNARPLATLAATEAPLRGRTLPTASGANGLREP